MASDDRFLMGYSYMDEAATPSWDWSLVAAPMKTDFLRLTRRRRSVTVTGGPLFVGETQARWLAEIMPEVYGDTLPEMGMNYMFHYFEPDPKMHVSCRECGQMLFVLAHFEDFRALNAAMDYYKSETERLRIKENPDPKERTELLNLLRDAVRPKDVPPRFSSIEEASAWLEERGKSHG